MLHIHFPMNASSRKLKKEKQVTPISKVLLCDSDIFIVQGKLFWKNDERQYQGCAQSLREAVAADKTGPVIISA